MDYVIMDYDGHSECSCGWTTTPGTAWYGTEEAEHIASHQQEGDAVTRVQGD